MSSIGAKSDTPSSEGNLIDVNCGFASLRVNSGVPHSPQVGAAGAGEQEDDGGRCACEVLHAVNLASAHTWTCSCWSPSRMEIREPWRSRDHGHLCPEGLGEIQILHLRSFRPEAGVAFRSSRSDQGSRVKPDSKRVFPDDANTICRNPIASSCLER